MKTIAWLCGGFVLLGLAGALERFGDMGAAPSERLPLFIAAALLSLGAPICFFRAIRSGLSDLTGASSKAAKRGAVAPAARPAYRLDGDEPANGFDADAAFAHYMEQRAAATAEAGDEDAVISAPAAPQPVRPAFGRRII